MKEHRVQFIAITFDDDSVGIMQFILDPRLPLEAKVPGHDHKTGKRKATTEAIQHEIDKSQWGERKVKSWKKITRTAVPKDRTFRNAWRLKSSKITVNMDHAREIHKDSLRQERAPLFEKLDTRFFRAMEKGSEIDVAAIGQAKQVLRDITLHPRVIKAKTPQELKKLTLSVLVPDIQLMSE